MKQNTAKDPDIVLSKQVKEAMAKDPELAAALRELFANMRQAMQSVKEGRYKSLDDAMEAITGQRPTPIDDLSEDEIFDEKDE